MIRIFTLNVSEEILNKFKDFEIREYFDNFSTPTAIVNLDDTFSKVILYPSYDRINSCILELRRRKKSN